MGTKSAAMSPVVTEITLESKTLSNRVIWGKGIVRIIKVCMRGFVPEDSMDGLSVQRVCGDLPQH